MNILFLCIANTQRSKTAEELFSASDKANTYRSAGLSGKYVQKTGSILCSDEVSQWADKSMFLKKCMWNTSESTLGIPI